MDKEILGAEGRGRILWLWLLILVGVGTAFWDGDIEMNIWPMPKWVTKGDDILYLNARNFQLITSGSNYTDPSGILKEAFSRFIHTLQLSHHSSSISNSNSSSSIPPSLFLRGIYVLTFSPGDRLQYGIDESYKLLVPSSEEQGFARLEANTIYGALHGLQTFSQLFSFDFKTREIKVPMVPWTIIDQPRFSYRGLLIDTSRHYQPLLMIKKIIDSMTYAKLNVLHWHIVDTQSFPLEIPSYPNLWNSAFSVSERYTFSDASDIVSYAQRRGINILAEIDIPGHASSWGVGYPALWPSKDCKQPLDVSKELTFEVIDGILSDFSKIFKFKFVHLGGDEVDTSCWKSTPHVKKWLVDKGMNESEAYQYFILQSQEIALSHGYDIINWEETFNNFGDKLSPKTVVHNWLGGGVAAQVAAAGLRCIVSNQDKWYLDHLDTTWEQFYMNEPLKDITKSEIQKLVIGGEVCMWGETVDGSNIKKTIWPRTAAAAERLWTPYEKLAKDPKHVTRRLAHFRCLLNQRGVAAAPLDGLGRGNPREPGSCFAQ